MSTLTIFSDSNSQQPLWHSEITDTIHQRLADYGVYFCRHTISTDVPIGASHTDLLTAYQPIIEQMVAEQGYQSWDIISMQADHPQKQQLRQQFLHEHTHAEDEVRLFVAGSGLFCLHVQQQVLQIFCVKGDAIAVPAQVPHWFDMGSSPAFTAIRLFNNPNGWIANFTGSHIAPYR